ncbi:hypothetical protein KI387_016350, partial [Taxus chinensis]
SSSFLDSAAAASSSDALKNYIVYMGDVVHPTREATISSNHHLLAKLDTATRLKEEQDVIHHYCKSFRGFSALLTSEEAASLSDMDEVVSVFESKTWPVHTTHSWEFLGVDQINPGINSGFTGDYMRAQSDVIIGVIDTGIWPESQSFDDAGLPPVPSQFKGSCELGEEFNASNCNRKIIGARFYLKGYEASNGPLESSGGRFFRSPRDADGHGTHTASIAAGAVVKNANMLGIINGTAKGGAPGARLAIYKACWVGLCNDADLLAAFDDAAQDGVDIISIAIGRSRPSLFEDAVNIGSFHAFSKGILVSGSAGNDGLRGTIGNVAPWIFTAGASSIDRSFSSNILLGNNMTLKGEALNPFTQDDIAGLVAGSSSGALGVSHTNASFCQENTLDPTKIKGKVVVCTMSDSTDSKFLKSFFVKQGGGAGIIVVDPTGADIANQFLIPATVIGEKEAANLMAYLVSDKNPTAFIETTVTVLQVQGRPEMAVFSSLGPNVIVPDIIKPDITAPGVSILAAWSPVATIAGQSLDFSVQSGTSMSCAHVSGVAALVKAQNPTWTPAAIKSAIMTTAYVLDNTNQPILTSPTGNPAGPFSYGSGHINPAAALDPGLVYDYDVDDLVDFLCSNGVTPSQLSNLVGNKITT